MKKTISNRSSTDASPFFIRIIFVGITALVFLGCQSISTIQPTETPSPSQTKVPTSTKTPKISATKTPKPVGEGKSSTPTTEVILFTIKSANLQLRKGADTRYEELPTIYHEGEKLKVIEKYGTWFYVEGSSGERGWVYIGWIDIDSISLTAIPTVQNTPVAYPNP